MVGASEKIEDGASPDEKSNSGQTLEKQGVASQDYMRCSPVSMFGDLQECLGTRRISLQLDGDDGEEEDLDTGAGSVPKGS